MSRSLKTLQTVKRADGMVAKETVKHISHASDYHGLVFVKGYVGEGAAQIAVAKTDVSTWTEMEEGIFYCHE